MKLSKNQRGASHHFLLPVLVILAIIGIGIYLLKESHAATTADLAPAATSKTPVLVSMGNRYFKVYSDGSGLTELKNEDGSKLAFSTDAHSSYYFSKLVGPTSDSTAEVYDINCYLAVVSKQPHSCTTVTPLNNLTNGFSDVSLSNIRFSTNGAHLLYALNSDNTSHRGIYTANPDGTNVKLAFNDSRTTDRIDNPSWQPWGLRIAYDFGGTLYTNDTSGKTPLNFGAVDLPNRYAWAPNGSMIGLVHSGDGHIYVFNSNGSNKRTFNAIAYSTIAFAPGGKQIAYHGADGLDVLDLDSKATKRIASLDNSGNNGEPNISWLTDGQIVYTNATGLGVVIMSVNPNTKVTNTIFKPFGGNTTAYLESQW